MLNDRYQEFFVQRSNTFSGSTDDRENDDELGLAGISSRQLQQVMVRNTARINGLMSLGTVQITLPMSTHSTVGTNENTCPCLHAHVVTHNLLPMTSLKYPCNVTQHHHIIHTTWIIWAASHLQLEMTVLIPKRRLVSESCGRLCMTYDTVDFIYPLHGHFQQELFSRGYYSSYVPELKVTLYFQYLLF